MLILKSRSSMEVWEAKTAPWIAVEIGVGRWKNDRNFNTSPLAFPSPEFRRGVRGEVFMMAKPAAEIMRVARAPNKTRFWIRER